MLNAICSFGTRAISAASQSDALTISTVYIGLTADTLRRSRDKAAREASSPLDPALNRPSSRTWGLAESILDASVMAIAASIAQMLFPACVFAPLAGAFVASVGLAGMWAVLRDNRGTGWQCSVA
jgi:hypothetical protein